MSAHNSKPSYLGTDENSVSSDPFDNSRYDMNHGNWQDSDKFSVGRGDGTHVLAINGFANAIVDIGLQTAVPKDYASIQITLGNIVNLDAFANAGATGSVTSAAASQGLLTLTNGNLSGTYTASLSIDVTANIPADHATIHLRITDSFQLSLSGTGYVGASLSATTAAGGTVVAMTPGGGTAIAPAGGRNDHFDLARFAASVLNTGQWNIAFMASAPGQSLHGLGTSVLTIAATAELAGVAKPELLNFQDTERSNIAFNDTSTPAMGLPHGLQVSGPNSVNLFHDV